MPTWDVWKSNCVFLPLVGHKESLNGHLGFLCGYFDSLDSQIGSLEGHLGLLDSY